MFFIKYLRILGFSATNDILRKMHGILEMRLSVQIKNLQKGIHETTEYLKVFLRNLLLNEKKHNRKISGL